MNNLVYIHSVHIYCGTEGPFETFIIGDVTENLVLNAINDYYTENPMMVQGNNVKNLIEIFGECGIPKMRGSRYANGESAYLVAGVQVGKVKIKRLVVFKEG